MTTMYPTDVFTEEDVTTESTLFSSVFPKRGNVATGATVKPTEIPIQDQNIIMGVVLLAMFMTLCVVGFILYRYKCSNQGDYLTAGEVSPGDYFFDKHNKLGASEKKEYFI